jgi:hypothetical protein
MNTEKTDLLIETLNDPSFSLLSDVARLSYQTFLRRVGNKISLTESHYLYQQAIHSGNQQATRSAQTRGNPQLRPITQLTGKSASASGDAEFSSIPSQPASGE